MADLLLHRYPAPVDRLLLQPGLVDSTPNSCATWLAASSSLTPTAQQWPSWRHHLQPLPGSDRPIKTARATTQRGFLLSPDYLGVHCERSILLLRPGLEPTGSPERPAQAASPLLQEHYEGQHPVLIIHIFLVFSFFSSSPHHLCCNLVIIRTLLTQQVQIWPAPRSSAGHSGWSCHTVLAVFIICFRAPPPRAAALDPGRAGLPGHRLPEVNDAHQVLSASLVPTRLRPIIYCFLTKVPQAHLTEKLYSMRESREVLPGHLGDGHGSGRAAQKTHLSNRLKY